MIITTIKDWLLNANVHRQPTHDALNYTQERTINFVFRSASVFVLVFAISSCWYALQHEPHVFYGLYHLALAAITITLSLLLSRLKTLTKIRLFTAILFLFSVIVPFRAGSFAVGLIIVTTAGFVLGLTMRIRETVIGFVAMVAMQIALFYYTGNMITEHVLVLVGPAFLSLSIIAALVFFISWIEHSHAKQNDLLNRVQRQHAVNTLALNRLEAYVCVVPGHRQFVDVEPTLKDRIGDVNSMAIRSDEPSGKDAASPMLSELMLLHRVEYDEFQSWFDEGTREQLQRLRTASPAEDISQRLQCYVEAGDSKFPAEIEITSLVTADKASETANQPGELLLLIRDLSRDYQNQAELQRAAEQAKLANLARQQFLSMIHHEFRTPMNGIVGSIEWLKYNGRAGDISEQIELLETSSNQLSMLIENLLEVSSIKADGIEVAVDIIDVRLLIEELIGFWRPLIEDSGVEFIAQVQPEVPGLVTTDPRILKQILSNLLSNAHKFTRAGSIELDISAVLPSDIDGLHSASRRVDLLIQIRDTGVGIADRFHQDIFDAFKQIDNDHRASVGSGVGLFIVKQMVNRLGGEYGLYSYEGEGSNFWVSIPTLLPDTLSESQGGTAAYPAASNTDDDPSLGEQSPDVSIGRAADFIHQFELDISNRPLAGAKLLIVEDNQINQTILHNIIEFLGGRTVTVENGQGAISYLEAHSQQIDLVLMDVNMPVMDGITACRLIRDDLGLAHLPIVFVTGTNLREQYPDISVLGANDVILKPLRVDQLVSVYQRLCNP